jgi:hypothetical protein
MQLEGEGRGGRGSEIWGMACVGGREMSREKWFCKSGHLNDSHKCHKKPNTMVYR